MTTEFDADLYKTTTRQQWEDAAEAWYGWGPTLEEWLGPTTERMLDAVRRYEAGGGFEAPCELLVAAGTR